MEIFKLNGDVKIDKSIIEKNIDDGYFLLNANEKKLYEYIEELNLNDISSYKIKLAYQINFDFDVHIKNKQNNGVEKKCENIYDVLFFMRDKNVEDYILILDTEDKSVLGNIIQQFIYLDKNIEVFFKKEEIERKVAHKYRKELKNITETIENAKKEISNIIVNEKLSIEKNGILEILGNISKILHESNTRELKISVMATKKAGKSVVVNSFLGEEYAPTSAELPTPNSCIYRKNENDGIELNYNNKTISFDSPNDIKAYILEEFKKAQKESQGCKLNDMEILYADNKNLKRKYTIIDTPGPDLAGAAHREVAAKWIEKSDVVIFVIDYGKHLTNGEEDFLKNIKLYFERYDKFYSFIVVVNKLDLMYMSGEKKSVVRFLDYLRFKMENLGYKGFFMLGTCALDYFNSLKIIEIKGCEELQTDNIDRFNEIMREARKKYQGKTEMEIVSYVYQQINRLGDFHGIWDANLETLKKHSGINKLIHFTNYIAEEKAIYELLKSSFYKIDQEFAILKNRFIVEQLSNLEFQKSELIKLIDELISNISRRRKELNEIIYFEYVNIKINEEIQRLVKGIKKTIEQQSEAQIEELEDTVYSYEKKSNELEKIEKGENNFEVNIDTSILEESIVGKLSDIDKVINQKLNGIEQKLVIKDKDIKKDIEEFNNKLKKEYNLDNFVITLPKFEGSFSKINIKTNTNINSVNLTYEIRDSIKRGNKLYEKLFNFVKRKGFKGNIGIDVNQVKNIFRETKKDINKKIAEKCVKIESDLVIECEKIIKNMQEKLSEQTKEIINNYEIIFKNIKEDLLSDKETTEEKIGFLRKIQDEIYDFDSIWEIIRKEGDSK